MKTDNASLFDFSQTIAAPLFEACGYPWEAIPAIGGFIADAVLPGDVYDNPSPGVWIARSAVISPACVIHSPAIICPGAELRPGAYIRGNVIVGECCVVGNSTELKNCILFNHAQVPHFNYVGDSVLGCRSHMGAGAVASNVKSDKTPVVIHGEEDIATGLRKFGAAVGDGAEIGCHCVLNPGTVIGRNTTVYPLIAVRGVIPENCIVKSMKNIVRKR